MSELGKWEIRRKTETSDAGIYEHGLGYVCFVPRPDVHPNLPAMYEKRLNLLFAAPDLYEALKLLNKVSESSTITMFTAKGEEYSEALTRLHKAQQVADAALLKAEGKES